MSDVWEWLSNAGKKVVGVITGRDMADVILPQPKVVTDDLGNPTVEWEQPVHTWGETFEIYTSEVPVIGDVRNALKGIGDSLKNLPKYIWVILIFLGIYLILMGRRGKSIA